MTATHYVSDSCCLFGYVPVLLDVIRTVNVMIDYIMYLEIYCFIGSQEAKHFSRRYVISYT